MKHLLGTAVALLCLANFAGCRQDSAETKKTPPASVAKPVSEQDLATITLTPRAVERLGIRTVELKEIELPRRKTLGGEVIVPPGQSVVVSAPFAGMLAAPDKGVPAPGSRLTTTDPVFVFTPLLTPERDVLTPAERVNVALTKANLAVAQLEAEREIDAAQLRMEKAQIAHDRAKDLFEDGAGSQRTVDESLVELNLAKKALETAQVRHEFLADVDPVAQAGNQRPIDITTPLEGVLETIHVAPGEQVAAGELLFSVTQLDKAWLKVPVYVGLWHEVDADAAAEVSQYGTPLEDAPRIAKPVTDPLPPPSADAAAGTLNLFYELDNKDRRLAPGQKLAVSLALAAPQKSLVVPWAAVLFDIHGGTWVYEQTTENTYVRRRVEVRYVHRPESKNGAPPAEGSEPLAVLETGPAPGTRVAALEELQKEAGLPQPEPGALIVTDGAAELFGTELGFGK